MLYDEKQLDKIRADMDNMIAMAGVEYYYEDAPLYIHGPNWTDELRNKNGFYEFDGKWQRRTPVKDYWSHFMNDVRSLMADKDRLVNELQLSKRKNYEMEYGLRVAAKSLEKSLQLTQEMINDGL